MSEQQLWERYAACWSAPRAERDPVLAASVDHEVVYRDPSAEVAGLTSLSDYMDGFRGAFPTGRFVIDRVECHHERSLAHWRQLDGSGQTKQLGISFARHAEDGRLREITGFFLDPGAGTER